MPDDRQVSWSWSPALTGVTEVFHASFTDHAYPLHSHDAWTVLLVERGVVKYHLGPHQRAAQPKELTVLPPFMAHDGRSARPGRAFIKRVLYLEPWVLGEGLVGCAVDRSTFAAPELWRTVGRLHDTFCSPADDLQREALLAEVVEGIGSRLRTRPVCSDAPSSAAAEALRAHLDADITGRHDLHAAATTLGWNTTHLIRSFTAEFGLPPHRYLIGRRIETARRQLLDGIPAAEVATNVGFYDQAHLTRHFKGHLAMTPGCFQSRRVG